MTAETLYTDVVFDGNTPVVLRVRVAGEIDVATAPALSETLTALVTSNPVVVALDLAAVTFLSCAGLRAIAVVSDKLGDRLHVVAASEPVRLLTELFGMSPAFPIAG